MNRSNSPTPEPVQVQVQVSTSRSSPVTVIVNTGATSTTSTSTSNSTTNDPPSTTTPNTDIPTLSNSQLSTLSKGLSSCGGKTARERIEGAFLRGVDARSEIVEIEAKGNSVVEDFGGFLTLKSRLWVALGFGGKEHFWSRAKGAVPSSSSSSSTATGWLVFGFPSQAEGKAFCLGFGLDGLPQEHTTHDN